MSGANVSINNIPLTLIQIVNLLLFFVLPTALLIWLQVRLSRRESRWPGLILPGLSLLLSIVVAAGLVLMMANVRSSVEQTSVEQAYESSDVESDVDEPETDDASIGIIGGADGPTAIFVSGPDFPSSALMLFPIFLLLNIPTAIELAIYAAFRRKRRKRADVDKSRIQDL